MSATEVTTEVGSPSASRSSPPRFRRPSLPAVLIALVVLGLVGHGLLGTGLQLERLLLAPERTFDFLSRAFPPATDRVPNFGAAMLETLEMAVIGTILGAALSLPVALLAARNTSPHRLVSLAATSALTTMRAIPDLVWALVFVVSVGLGPLAGILTITLDVLAFAGRFFAERIEEVDAGPVDALKSTGAGRLAVIACAVVLGLVGAGGIGVELNVAFQLRRFDTGLTVILLILVVVILVERLSSTIRQRALVG